MDAETIASAEGAARLLAALIPAQAVAHRNADYLPGYVLNDLDNRVATLLSVVKGYAEKCERSLAGICL